MASRVDAQPTTVLVVEDEVLVRMMAADILTNARFDVVEARDAQEAMTILKARSDVRIVFTDWNMPGAINGSELAYLVSKYRPEIGIIVTSGMMRPALGDLPKRARFLSKPYRPSAVIDEAKALLREGLEVERGVSVLPDGIVMQSPVMAEMGSTSWTPEGVLMTCRSAANP